MAFNATLIIPNSDWTLVTANGVDQLSFQCLTGVVDVTATSGLSQPGANPAVYRFQQLEGAVKFALADYFPGVTGADNVWMRGVNYTPQVTISHD